LDASGVTPCSPPAEDIGGMAMTGAAALPDMADRRGPSPGGDNAGFEGDGDAGGALDGGGSAFVGFDSGMGGQAGGTLVPAVVVTVAAVVGGRSAGGAGGDG
jgi:hypothetical protein